MISWEGHVPTQVDLQCGDETHWVRWEDGELIALNHPEASGERTLAALAGERVACIEFLELWTRHRDDLGVLALASRGPGDPITLQPPGLNNPRFGRSGWAVATGGVMVARQAVYSGTRSAAIRQPMPARLPPGPSVGPVGPFEHPLVRLITTAGPLTDRLVATVSSIWAERVRSHDGAAVERRPALQAALYGRAVAAVRTWLGAPRLSVDVRMADEGQPASLRRGQDGPELQLPFSWISDVWARGLAVLLGRFVLRVVESSTASLTLEVVSPDLSGTRSISITL